VWPTLCPLTGVDWRVAVCPVLLSSRSRTVVELRGVKSLFLLPCRCGKNVAIEKAQAGQRVRCSCGLDLDVPTMQAIGRLEPALVEGPLEHVSRGWGLWQGMVLLGGALAMLAVGWAVYLGLTWPKAPPIDFDRLSPARTISAWHVLRSDPARRGPLDENPGVAEAQKVSRYWLVAAAGVGCLGLAIAAGALLLIRPRALRQEAADDDAEN
jgi:hypothetical protein